MQGLGWCVPRSKASCHAPFHNWNRCKITKIFETQHIFCKKNPYYNCFIEKFCHFQQAICIYFCIDNITLLKVS